MDDNCNGQRESFKQVPVNNTFSTEKTVTNEEKSAKILINEDDKDIMSSESAANVRVNAKINI